VNTIRTGLSCADWSRTWLTSELLFDRYSVLSYCWYWVVIIIPCTTVMFVLLLPWWNHTVHVCCYWQPVFGRSVALYRGRLRHRDPVSWRIGSS